MIIEINTKWMTKSTDIMKSKFKELRQNLKLIVADSKAHNIINSG